MLFCNLQITSKVSVYVAYCYIAIRNYSSILSSLLFKVEKEKRFLVARLIKWCSNLW